MPLARNYEFRIMNFSGSRVKPGIYASVRGLVGLPRESRRAGTVELSLVFLFFCCIFVGIVLKYLGLTEQVVCAPNLWLAVG